MPKLVIYKPAKPPPPAPPSPAAVLCDAVLVGLVIVGLVSVLHWLDGQINPLPAPGLTCYRIVKETAAGRTYDRYCERSAWRYPVRD